MTRKEIYNIIEKDDGFNIWSHIYYVFMFCCIILSVASLVFWDNYPISVWIELFTATTFFIDNMLRWVTADYKLEKVLTAVLIFGVACIFVTALMMSNFEPCINPNTGQETFRTFFDVIYCSKVTLTTVG